MPFWDILYNTQFSQPQNIAELSRDAPHINVLSTCSILFLSLYVWFECVFCLAASRRLYVHSINDAAAVDAAAAAASDQSYFGALANTISLYHHPTLAVVLAHFLSLVPFCGKSQRILRDSSSIVQCVHQMHV